MGDASGLQNKPLDDVDGWSLTFRDWSRAVVQEPDLNQALIRSSGVVPYALAFLLHHTENLTPDSEGNKKLALRRGISFLSNFITMNTTNQKELWPVCFPLFFHTMLDKTQLVDSETFMRTCMLIHNCSCNIPAHKKDLIGDEGTMILHVLLHNLTDHERNVVEHSSFEWTVYILSGLLPDLHLFYHSLSESKQLPSHSQVQLLKMWDAILSKTPDRAKEMSLETADFMLQYFTRCFSLEAEYQADNNLKEVIVTLISIFGATTAVGEGELNEFLTKKGLVQLIVQLLKDFEKESDGNEKPKQGLKSQLMRIIANLSLHSSQCQNMVREEGGLIHVLNGCIIDKENPWLREWSILAIRNLTEGNPENQRFISELSPQGVPSEVTEDMAEIGVDVNVKDGTINFGKRDKEGS